MKWFLTITAMLFLAASMALGFLGHHLLLLPGGIGFVGLLVAANLDRISEFKASREGFEARTRDVLARAEVAVNELHLLATQVAELSLSLVKRQGRLGGYTDDEEESIRSSVLTVLDKLRLPDGTNEKVLREWHQFVEFDYVVAILGGSRIPEGVNNEEIAEWKSLLQGGIASYPSPSELRVFLEKHGFITDEVERRIQDYEFYIHNRAHRRPDEWKNRERWGHLIKA